MELWAARGEWFPPAGAKQEHRRRTRGAGARLAGERPSSSPPALLCLLSRWIFPSSGLGLCGGEAADGESQGALIGPEMSQRFISQCSLSRC